MYSYPHGARPRPTGNPAVSGLLAAWHLEERAVLPEPSPPRGFHSGAHRNADPLYDVPERRIVSHLVEGPVRTSSTRGLGAFGNVFAIESFVDELAHAAGADPVAFRLAHLGDPRARAVIEAGVELAGGLDAPGGVDAPGRGMAFARYENHKTYVCVVVEVEVVARTGGVRLRRAWIAADAGEIVDPDGLTNQLEGGLVQAASWALVERVDVGARRRGLARLGDLSRSCGSPTCRRSPPSSWTSRGGVRSARGRRRRARRPRPSPTPCSKRPAPGSATCRCDRNGSRRPSPPSCSPASTVLAMEPDAVRAAELRKMKRTATAVLAFVAVVFVALLVAGGDGTVVDYALAAAEGSMVGGLADWFAVTALFRHPLGIPIPHTAIIRERKDQFGETLGSFVQENFLTADVVAERIRAARVAERIATWLATPANADRVAGNVLEGLVGVVDLVGDDDVHRLLHEEIERAVRSIPFATLAGRALHVGVDEGRHRPMVDGILKGAVTFLDEQREPLRTRFGDASPWWLPGALEDRFFDRLIDGARMLLASIAADPNHEMRAELDTRLRTLADRLQHDPELAAKAEALVGEALASPDVRGWTRSLWTDLKGSLRVQVDDPSSSTLRPRIAEAVVAIGGRLAEDPSLQARLSGAAESAVRYVATHHRSEISSLISSTIARWDAQETSDKLELLLGRDLQFIRINGTVVGGLAGVAIHGIADVLR